MRMEKKGEKEFMGGKKKRCGWYRDTEGARGVQECQEWKKEKMLKEVWAR